MYRKVFAFIGALAMVSVVVSGVYADDGGKVLRKEVGSGGKGGGGGAGLVGPNPTFHSAVLYDQTANPSGDGAPAQDFEASFDNFDSTAADDFVVTGTGWTVDGIQFLGAIGDPVANGMGAVLAIHADSGGAIGAAVCSPTVTLTGDGSVLNAEFDAPCNLMPGTYWVLFHVIMDFGAGGQWFWTNTATITNSAAQWQNPGDGFGSGCTTFQPAGSVCGVGGGLGSMGDFLFVVYGDIYVPPAEGISIGYDKIGQIRVIAPGMRLYEAPGGGPVRDAAGNEIWVPNQGADNPYEDTYDVLATEVIGNTTWVQIFIGSLDFVWLPVGGPVTVIELQ